MTIFYICFILCCPGAQGWGLLGEHYRDQGISYRAKEEFERVLVLDPANKRARRQLRRMGYGDAY